MSNQAIVRAADICDIDPNVQVVELTFHDFAKRRCFHGEAVTFSTYETNKGLMDVLKRGGEGKVLVVDGRGSQRHALTGGNIAEDACKLGWEGIIYNGAVRDVHEIMELDFGVKALCSTPVPPHRNAEGIADVMLRFGGVVINPGDYIYADIDGVIVCQKPMHS